LNIRGWTVGPLAENPYLLTCTRTNKAVLVDPGDDAPRLLQAIASAKVKLEAILLTHGHLDHVGALTDVRLALGVPVYLHAADDWLLEYASALWQQFGKTIAPIASADHALADGDEFRFGSVVLEVLHTPGHTPGGVCFYAPEDDVLVSGDTLFQRAVGRTDLPGGDAHQLIDSIWTQLYTLPDRTRVYPGHGAMTTIGEEKRHNPWTSTQRRTR
jgi:hydroxyacylglutathione hydrolase